MQRWGSSISQQGRSGRPPRRQAQGFGDAGLGRVSCGDTPDHAAGDAVIIDDLGGPLARLAQTKKIRAAVRRVVGMLQSHFSGSLFILLVPRPWVRGCPSVNRLIVQILGNESDLQQVGNTLDQKV